MNEDYLTALSKCSSPKIVICGMNTLCTLRFSSPKTVYKCNFCLSLLIVVVCVRISASSGGLHCVCSCVCVYVCVCRRDRNCTSLHSHWLISIGVHKHRRISQEFAKQSIQNGTKKKIIVVSVMEMFHFTFKMKLNGKVVVATFFLFTQRYRRLNIKQMNIMRMQWTLNRSVDFVSFNRVNIENKMSHWNKTMKWIWLMDGRSVETESNFAPSQHIFVIWFTHIFCR